MSFRDQKRFISSINPFDELNSDELDGLIKGIDIAFFKKDKIIIDTQESPQYLYVIIKGEVRSEDNRENRVMIFHFQEDSLMLMDLYLEYPNIDISLARYNSL